MREIRTSGSEGGGVIQLSLPLSNLRATSRNAWLVLQDGRPSPSLVPSCPSCLSMSRIFPPRATSWLVVQRTSRTRGRDPLESAPSFLPNLDRRLLFSGTLWNAFLGMSGKSARRYVVQGRVQGVGFRWFVQRRAVALGITGYVRNLDEGHVEVLAMGPAESLDRLREELGRGPVGARVTSVQESEAPAAGYRSFEITY